MNNKLGADAAYESLVVHGNSSPTAEDVCNEATRMLGLRNEAHGGMSRHA